jgi:hypothetical protein
MATSVITFQDLEHDHANLKQSASTGPVFVVEGETPSLVVLSFADYERLRSKGPTLGEALSMPFGTPDEALDYEFPELGIRFNPVDPHTESNPLAGRTVFDLFNHEAFDSLPDDFEFTKLDLELKPADLS